MNPEKMTLTCDIEKGVRRVALWKGPKIEDIFLDRIDKPDLTGARYQGKVSRLAPKGKGAWVDVGLSDPVFLPKSEGFVQGQTLIVEIVVPPRQGKAFLGKSLSLDPEKMDPTKLGIPLTAWQRALSSIKNEASLGLRFSSRADYLACESWLKDKPHKAYLLAPFSKEPVHPELDDILDELRSKEISVSASCRLTIETTEALTAIDIDGDMGMDALAINLQAAKEIARQIRLRNLAGILVVDALKMSRREDHAKLIHAFKHAVTDDPCPVQVFGITKLGLLELTRQRKGASLEEVLDA